MTDMMNRGPARTPRHAATEPSRISRRTKFTFGLMAACVTGALAAPSAMADEGSASSSVGSSASTSAGRAGTSSLGSTASTGIGTTGGRFDSAGASSPGSTSSNGLNAPTSSAALDHVNEMKSPISQGRALSSASQLMGAPAISDTLAQSRNATVQAAGRGIGTADSAFGKVSPVVDAVTTAHAIQNKDVNQAVSSGVSASLGTAGLLNSNPAIGAASTGWTIGNKMVGPAVNKLASGTPSEAAYAGYIDSMGARYGNVGAMVGAALGAPVHAIRGSAQGIGAALSGTPKN